MPLTSKAFETLLVFVQHRGQLLDKDTLMKAVWPNVVVEENNLNQSISALRRVLGDSRDEHHFIVTVPGRGYRFVSDVRVITDDSMPASDSANDVETPAAPASQLTPLPVSPPGYASPGPRRNAVFIRPATRWAGIVVAGILVCGALVWAYVYRNALPIDLRSITARPVPGASAQGDRPRLAIMPFANLSPDPANAFFADGLHEEILSTLSQRMAGVAVISRTTMMSYRQRPKPLGAVARELGATHVMEGTVRREGDRVRLTLQLVDAGSDRYLWSQTYDRALASAMTLQSEVAAEVASQLPVRLVSVGVGTAPVTRDAEAYDLYLRALLGFRDLSGNVGDAYDAVEDLLNRVLSRDPEFALAYAQRARLHTLTLISSIDTSDENYRSILTDLDAARRRAPHDPIVLAAVGYYLLADGEITRALEAMQSADAAGLQDAEWLIPKTRLLLSRARVDEAVRVHERMLSLDPANPLVLIFTTLDYLLAQRPEAALRVAKMASVRFPEIYNYWQGYIGFATRGELAAYRKAVDPWLAQALARADPDAFSVSFLLLRCEHRYAEILDVLRHVPTDSLKFSSGADSQIFDSVGERPVAEYRGWAYMLLNDRAHAREQGRAVLAFLAHHPESKWNRFFRQLIAAQGYTFTGQKQEAIAAARTSLELMPRSKNAVAWVGAASLAARVYAWNGAENEAVTLLEALVNSAPGMQPALITRDPLFTVPLAGNARFQALAAQLEERMKQPLM